MIQYQLFELCFFGKEPKNSLTQVDLEALFVCGDCQVRAKGFYDGNGIYKVRFLPRKTGLWHWRVSGAVEASGEALCTEAPGHHGPVKAHRTHFIHEDGTPYYPFGTTVYALVHQEDALVEQTLKTLETAPFNKVRMCVFPKFFPLVNNEPPLHPFEKKGDGWDVHRPNFPFWHRFEGYLDRLEDMGIQVDLILFHPYDRWGYCAMSREENLTYLDLVLRRFAARPNIWWSMANEYDVVPGWELEDWYAVEEFLAENDPYGHLLGNHNCTAFYDHARPNITHVSLQTRWVIKTADWVREYGKPVINDEMCYEGDLEFPWGNISGQELTHRIWTVCAMGGYGTHGETFMDENDVVWWARGGTLRGQSISRIRFLKELLYSLPGPLEPMEARSMLDLVKIPPEKLAEMKSANPTAYVFARGLQRMEPMSRQVFADSETRAESHCGDDAFLTYYGRFCPHRGVLELPEDGSYRVEVIDTWEMTRTTAAVAAGGRVEVSLPGKECMAILAVREKA